MQIRRIEPVHLAFAALGGLVLLFIVAPLVGMLIASSPAELGDTARERLNVMRSTEDGFVIAEKDLLLRGGGEVLGTRQSGLPAFRIAMLPEHQDLLEAARDEARLGLTRDPELKAKDAEALRVLLYLFERDDAVRLIRAG